MLKPYYGKVDRILFSNHGPEGANGILQVMTRSCSAMHFSCLDWQSDCNCLMHPIWLQIKVKQGETHSLCEKNSFTFCALWKSARSSVNSYTKRTYWPTGCTRKGLPMNAAKRSWLNYSFVSFHQSCAVSEQDYSILRTRPLTRSHILQPWTSTELLCTRVQKFIDPIQYNYTKHLGGGL